MSAGSAAVGMFDALVQESGSPIVELGGMIFGGTGSAAGDLLVTVKDALVEAHASNSVHDLYDALQARRKAGEIDEATLRDAIDQLYAGAGGR